MAMHKFCTTMVLSVTAIFLSSSHNVYAADTLVYQCISNTGQVCFQDHACTAEQGIESQIYLAQQEVKAVECPQQTATKSKDSTNVIDVRVLIVNNITP